MTAIRTVAELRRVHVVSSRSNVIHWSKCPQVKRTVRAPLVPIGDDPRYYAGELRPGKCCFPIVPRPDAPENEPGWKWAVSTP